MPNPTALRQLLLCQWNSLIVHCRSAINLSVCTPGVIFTKMAELLLDSDIRIWVFLPIIMITFLVGVLRHYLSTIISSQKKVELQQVQDRYHHSHLLLVNLIQLVFLSFFFLVRRWFVLGYSEKMGNICLNKRSSWGATSSIVKMWAISRLRKDLLPQITLWLILMPWVIWSKAILPMSYPW